MIMDSIKRMEKSKLKCEVTQFCEGLEPKQSMELCE